MNNQIRIAQKGLILSNSRDSILVIKYAKSKYLPHEINGKYGLPGGQIDFGELPDKSFVREVYEETGVNIKVGDPFYIWSWEYKKEGTDKQIIAVAPLGYYESGEPKILGMESESTIELVKWLKLNDLQINEFVEDEKPILIKYLSSPS